MVEEGLVVKFKGDVSDLETASNKAASSFKIISDEANKAAASAAASVGKLSNTLETLRGKLEARKNFILTEQDINKIAQYNKEIEQLEKDISRLQNVGRTGFDNLGNRIDKFGNTLNTMTKRNGAATQSLINLSRVAQDAPYGFIGIANNLNPLLESFQRLKAESTSGGSALKALAGGLIGPAGLGLALGVVSSLVVAFGDKLFKSGDAAKSNAEKLKEAKKALQDYVEGLDDVIGANLKGSQAAQEQLVALQTLYNATQNANIPLAKRKKLVDQLQEQYPKYFANIKDETILAGGAKKAYDELSAAILASARARAAEESLVDIQKQVLAAEQKTADALKAQTVIYRQIAELKNSGQKATETSLTGEERLTSTGAELNRLQQQLADKTKDVNDAYRERIALNERAKNLSNEVNRIVQTNPDALLKPTGKETSSGKDQFNFFDKFFDVNPKTATDKAKQAIEMYKTAMDFALKNEKIFVGLSEIIAAPTQADAIAAGRKFWDAYQRGLIDTRPDISPILKFDIKTPTDFFKDSTKELDKSNPDYEKFLKKKFENITIRPHVNIVPQEDTNADAANGLKKVNLFFKEIENAKILSSVVQSTLTPAFDSLFSAIQTGGSPLQAFFSSLGQMVQQLITKLLSAAAVAAVLSALVPGGGGFTAQFTKILGFSKGGRVPGSGSSDTVPAMLTPGEFVLSKDMIAKIQSGNLSVLPKVLGSITLPTTPSFQGITANIPSIAPSSITQSLSNVKPAQVRTEAPDYIPIMRGDQLLLMNNRAGRKQGRVS